MFNKRNTSTPTGLVLHCLNDDCSEKKITHLQKELNLLFGILLSLVLALSQSQLPLENGSW